MNGTVIVLQPTGTRIPAELPDLAAFRAWTRSADFPENGRIDWISGEVEIEFKLYRPQRSGYVATPPDPKGFLRSEVLGRSARLVRLPARSGAVRHRLEWSGT